MNTNIDKNYIYNLVNNLVNNNELNVVETAAVLEVCTQLYDYDVLPVGFIKHVQNIQAYIANPYVNDFCQEVLNQLGE